MLIVGADGERDDRYATSSHHVSSWWTNIYLNLPWVFSLNFTSAGKGPFMASKVHLFLLKGRGGGGLGAPPAAEKLPFGNQTTGSFMRRVPASIHTYINTCTQIIVDILSLPLSLKILSSKFLNMSMQALILQASSSIT